MQATMYLAEEDVYLLQLIDKKFQKERKSRSAVVFSIIEEYFKKGHRLGEILIEFGVLLGKNLVGVLLLLIKDDLLLSPRRRLNKDRRIQGGQR